MTGVQTCALPISAVIQFSRMVLVDGVVPSARAHLFLLGVTAVMLAAGVLIFKRHAPRAAEYL